MPESVEINEKNMESLDLNIRVLNRADSGADSGVYLL